MSAEPIGHPDVRGGATPEEVAAVLAVLTRPRPSADQRYAAWRRGRLAALRQSDGTGHTA